MFRFKILTLRKIYTMLVALIVLSVAGCSYSFTGASIPQHLNSVYIPASVDKSGSGLPYVGQFFTEKITAKFIEDNNLSISNSRNNADAVLECTISSFSNTNQAVSPERNRTNQRQVKITVQVVYRDLVKKKTIFERSFEEQDTFEPQGDLSSAVETSVKSIINKITDNILISVVSNW